MKGLIVAIQFLTRLPTPRITVSGAEFAAAIRWFPAVGLILGAIVAAGCRAGAEIDPWTAALAGLVLWVAVTGALHLDGLGDLADGLGAAHGDRTRLLAVMRDPHIGSFGVTTIALQLAAKLVLLHLILPAGWLALIAIPAAARLGPLVWARFLPPLRDSGLGASIAGAITLPILAIWGVLLAAACVLLPPLAATPLLIALLGWWMHRRVGGVTGDVHGAGIELIETGLLLAVVLQAAR